MTRNRRVPLAEIEVTIVPVQAPPEEYERVWCAVLGLIHRMHDESRRISFVVPGTQGDLQRRPR